MPRGEVVRFLGELKGEIEKCVEVSVTKIGKEAIGEQEKPKIRCGHRYEKP